MFLLLFLIYFILISILLATIFIKPQSNKFKLIYTKNEKYDVNETLKNRFSLKKIPDCIDTIIIGSGMSSLTLGCILSRTGKKY